MKTCHVVSRQSQLALIQTREALSYLDSLVPGTIWNHTSISSLGDKHKDVSLLDGSAPADFFTRELDDALQKGHADCAVHSAKDLPWPLAPDLAVVALLPARNQGDCLVAAPGVQFSSLDTLPPGARVGTSSPQRREQLLALRPDLDTGSIRGTIEERIAQVDSGAFHAIVVARCALERLGLEHRISLDLPFRTHPLQGHLAVTALSSRKDMRTLWAPADIRATWGRVSLAGAGPGDPELLTLKAQRLIRSADVILHDALANPAILPQGVECINVGKRMGLHTMTQDQTNELMHTLARQGKNVVRLKGGDPFIFGRGGEEFRYLQERLVAVEVVPGISSALAAAACTGISLTDRNKAASLALCTGYPLDRIQVPAADTRVYFMGAHNQAAIVQKNLDAGYSPDTPVLLVANASLPDQTSRFTTLGELAAAPSPLLPLTSSSVPTNVPNDTSSSVPNKDSNNDTNGPVLTIIGPVASPAQPIWWDRRWKLWYTGTDSQAVYRQGIDRKHPEGIALSAVPLTQVSPPKDWQPLDQAITNLTDYDWIFFTSPHGVRFFWMRLKDLGLDSRHLAHCKIAAVGQSTARVLQAQGINPDLVPQRQSGKGLAEAFVELAAPAGHALKVLVPASDLALRHLDSILAQAGHTVTRLASYHTCERDTHPGVDLDTMDEVLLASPSSARALARWYPALPPNLVVSSMGEETRATVLALWPRRQT